MSEQLPLFPAPGDSKGRTGLKLTKLGMGELVVVHTPYFKDAIDRHNKLLTALDTDTDLTPGARVLLLLPANEGVLCLNRLRAATSRAARVYKSSEEKFLEFSLEGGWLDRRTLSHQTANAIANNAGPGVSLTDWRRATEFLGHFYSDLKSCNVWEVFLADAQAWWSQHVPGPLFVHMIGCGHFQLLDRAALARKATGLPQKSILKERASDCDDDVTKLHATSHYSDDLALFDELINFTGQVARDKPAKAVGRNRILEKAQQLTPAAQAAGRGQLIALGGVKHALKAGGVRGDLWAPITVYEYLRQGVKDLAIVLMKPSVDSMEGEDFHREYARLLANVKVSQRKKLEAFLLAFHRFLVIAGFDPLPRALSGKLEPLPPMAAVVTEVELSLALLYISRVAPDERVQLQARLGLLIGYWIPMRTIELWCLRVVDVHIRVPMFMVIYPRQRDGVDKTDALRRQEDVEPIPSTELKTALIDMVNLRRGAPDYADDEDFLFGRPGYAEERHELHATTQLMNDALRWATGNPDASYYDLRHTVFSRRAEPSLLGAINGD